MRFKRGRIAAAVIALAAGAASGATPANPAPDVGAMESADYQVISEARNTVLQKRERQAQQLIAIAGRYIADGAIKKELRNESIVTSAIELLGKTKSEQAIPFLLSNLTLTPYITWSGSSTQFYDIYPCARALMMLGMDAVDPLVDRAVTTSDPLYLRLTEEVVEGVLGSRAALAYLDERPNDPLADAMERQRLAKIKHDIAEDGRKGEGNRVLHEFLWRDMPPGVHFPAAPTAPLPGPGK